MVRIDGVSGNGTRKAIREYKRVRGLPEDGKIGQQLAALSNAEYACETEDFELRLRSRSGRERRQSVQEVACIENRAALLQQLSQQELTLTFTLFHHGCRRGDYRQVDINDNATL